jgi:hypothetical protein
MVRHSQQAPLPLRNILSLVQELDEVVQPMCFGLLRSNLEEALTGKAYSSFSHVHSF